MLWTVPATTAQSAEPPFSSMVVGPTPESVVMGFDGRLYVTLMGERREKGDGDGRVVVVDEDRVSTFASGFDDPKGIVFFAGRLLTTDFDKIWAIDARGEKTLLAGPEKFPTPPRYLNDIVIEPGEQSLLVTDMGDTVGMFSAPGILWPPDSDAARAHTAEGRILRVTGAGEVAIAIAPDPVFPNPNGVDVLDDGTILVAEFFRGVLLSHRHGEWRQLSDGHRSADGIVHDGAGNLYLTEVFSGKVWHIVAGTGEKRLLATLSSAADLLLDEARQRLIVPDSRAGRLVYIPLHR